MNVGFSLLTLFPGQAGGAESYVRGLLAAYAAGAGPEMTTALVSRHSAPVVERLAGPHLKVQHVPSYRPGDSDLTRLLAMGAARITPARTARDLPANLDLIHYPVTVPIPRLQGVARVVSLLDVQHHDLPGAFSAAERRFRRWAYDDSARQADQVITITSFSAERIAERLGIDRGRIHPIHLGIDHERFTPNGPTTNLHGLPERYLYYPANAWPHKNHKLLLDAFSQIEDPSLHLILTGSGDSAALMHSAGQRIHHLGHVPADHVAPLLRGAQALIFPSLYEGFGLPPLEAMACGCPVAASNTGAVAEVCGDAALLFDPTSSSAVAGAIEQITSDQALRDQLRQSGIARAAGFTWDATAKQHSAVYRQALEWPKR